MAKTRIRPEQAKTLEVFDDQKAAGSTLEDPTLTLEGFLQGVISQVNRVLHTTAGGNDWFADLVAPVTFEGGSKRGVDTLNQALHDFERQRLLTVSHLLVDITVPTGQDFVVLGAGETPPVTTAAVGNVTTLGTVVAAHTGTFGTHSLDEVSGLSPIRPKNLIPIVQGSLRDPILSSGRQVYGLLQTENATDGHTMIQSAPNRVQISFVRLNATGDDLEACPVASIENQIINYSAVERIALATLPEQAFLPGAAFDSPAGGGGGGASAWIDLTDTPASITANAAVRGNSGGTALEFFTPITAWTNLTDTPGTITASRAVRGNAGGTALEFAPSAYASAWTGLSDTPGSIAILKPVRGNATGTALEFAPSAYSTATTFTALTDTPGTITASRPVRGNAGGTALEFGSSAYATAWTGLSDTPGTITASRPVRGNAGGTALEFAPTAYPTAWTALSDTPGTITASRPVRGNAGGTALEFGSSAYATAWTGLTDTPGSITALRPVRGNVTGTALEFAPSPYSTVSSWTGLSDTPGAITADRAVKGNATGTSLEFATNPYADTFTDLTDTPGTITALRAVRGNAGGTALEFAPGSYSTVTAWIGLSDTPGTITASRAVRGNAGGTALEFAPSAYPTAWTGLTDTPGFITASRAVRGNAGGTALEFAPSVYSTVSSWTDLSDTPGSLIASYYPKVNALGTAIELVSSVGGGGVSTFVALTDTPGAITASRAVRGNAGGTALEFAASAYSTVAAWTDLSDTPGTITASRAVKGNAGGTALEFATNAYSDFALTATAPVAVTKAAAAVGVATEAARQDHKHDVTTAAPSSIGTANSEGSATSLARSDHVHNHGSQTDGGHHAVATGSVAGFLSASDKTKLDALVSPGFQDPKQSVRVATTAAGTLATSFENGDTIDGVVLATGNRILIKNQASAVENGIYTVNATGAPTRATDLPAASNAAGVSVFIEEGTANADTGWLCTTNASADVVGTDTLAFAKFTESTVITSTAPANVTKAAASAGVSSEVARADHKHDITTATPGTITVGAAAAEGSATSLARSDHTHALTAPAAPVAVTKAAASAGVAATVARSDHKHDVTTAAPSATAVQVGNTAAEGAATSLARSDHTHTVTGGTPVNVTKAANAAGTATTFARSDHKHDVTTAAPSSVGTANAEGTATSLARSDHVHNHGNQAGGSLHADVIAAGASGFMTGADKTKLDGVEALADVTDATNVAAAGAVMDADFAGSYAGLMHRTGSGAYQALKSNLGASTDPTATDDSASDYAVGSRWINTTADTEWVCLDATAAAAVWTETTQTGGGGVPTSRILTAGAGLTGGGDLTVDRTFDVVGNADGSITVNANDIQVGILATDAQHGSRGGGTQHANAIAAGAAGFMTGADKSKLDGVATGATATPLTATAPVAVTKATAAVGVSTEAARQDHKHDISTAAPSGTAVQIGNSAAEGSATSLARSDHTHTVASGSPVSVGTANSAGAATTFARSDHVHAHGNQTVGTLHATATTSVAGFMSAADKTKFDALPTLAEARWKQTVRVATTANGTLATAYENGDTIDGVVLATGNRILLKDQTTASENGIYTVNATGAPTRAGDLPATADAAGLVVIAQEGTANADTAWLCTSNTGSAVVGTNNLAFAELGGGGGSGDVSGPGAAVEDYSAVVWDGITGTDIKESNLKVGTATAGTGTRTLGANSVLSGGYISGSGFINASGLGAAALGGAIELSTGSATVSSLGVGTIVIGTASAGGSANATLTATSGADGSFVIGRAVGSTSASLVQANASLGTVVAGYATDGGTVEAISSSTGSFVHGFANSGGIVRATGAQGAFVNAVADGANASAIASQDGAVILGYVFNTAGTGAMTASSFGALAVGYVSQTAAGTSAINATAIGSIAGGQVYGGSTIECTLGGTGGFAHGRAIDGGVIQVSDNGGFAAGYAANGSTAITASQDGAFAVGYCSVGNLTASGQGSSATGIATAGGSVVASGTGATATGYGFGAAITASNTGALAGGYAFFTAITASGPGSFAWGQASGGNTVAASATNAAQFGTGTNSTADSLQVGSNFIAKASGAHAGARQTITLGAAATTFAIASTSMEVTGNGGGNTIATITGGTAGQFLALQFVDANVTITDDNTHAANSVDLNAAFTGADDTILFLYFDGTSWYEVSRSVN